MNTSIIISADIGGSHITTGLVDINKRIVVNDLCIRKIVNSSASAKEIVKTWCLAISELSQKAGFKPEQLSIAIPGPCDYYNGICWIRGLNKYESLYGLNIKDLIAQELDIDPDNIYMQNDAPCFLQGEIFGGTASNYSSAIGITLGTGFGTAIYKDGVTKDAELWQTPFKDSIAEYYFSTNWFLKRYNQLTGKIALNVKALADEAPDDQIVQKIFTEFGCNLGMFLKDIIEITHPQAIICGGNISNAFDLFVPHVREQLNGHSNTVTVERAVLGEKSALIGAASSWQSRKYINTLN